MQILLLEDDRSLRQGIAFTLTRTGYSVKCAGSIAEVKPLLESAFDLAILDVGLSDGSGLDICQTIRIQHPATYILFLTALDTELDMILGYESGADDYLTKPFSVSVLKSKIAAFARRQEQKGITATHGQLRLDTARQCVYKGRVCIELSRNELRLLQKLMNHSGQVLSKQQLLLALWDIDDVFVDENTLAVNIRRLREKIEDDPSKPKCILNVRGVGYRFAERIYEA